MSYFTSKDKTPAPDKLERKRYIYVNQQKDIYWYRILVGLEPKPTSDEKILKTRKLLLSKFFHFVLRISIEKIGLFCSNEIATPTSFPCWCTGWNLVLRQKIYIINFFWPKKLLQRSPLKETNQVVFSCLFSADFTKNGLYSVKYTSVTWSVDDFIYCLFLSKFQLRNIS